MMDEREWLLLCLAASLALLVWRLLAMCEQMALELAISERENTVLYAMVSEKKGSE
jgi:hypothetical protein